MGGDFLAMPLDPEGPPPSRGNPDRSWETFMISWRYNMIGIIQKCLLFCQGFDFTKSFTMYSIDDVSCFNVDVTSCWVASELE